MRILSVNKNITIDRVVEALLEGGIVVFPTETCYGVGVDATNPKAVDKLLEYKSRPEGKAISVAVSSVEMAEKYVHLNSEAKSIYDRFLPGPVTVISKSKKFVDSRLESEAGTLGIRIPDSDFIIAVIKKLGKPITATSANASGKKTPYCLDDIKESMPKRKYDMVGIFVDSGKLPKRPPSVVIDTTLEDVVVYRKGSINFGSKTHEISSNSPGYTTVLGEQFITKYKGVLLVNSLVVLLSGSIGAGKTYFTKGIAKGLGISKDVKSPSYTYVIEYKHRFTGEERNLFHFDAWRLNSEEDINMVIEDRWFEQGNVIVVEWAGKVLENLKDVAKKNNSEFVQVEINYNDIDSNDRMISIYE